MADLAGGQHGFVLAQARALAAAAGRRGHPPGPRDQADACHSCLMTEDEATAVAAHRRTRGGRRHWEPAMHPAPGPADPGRYKRFVIRRADWISSGTALQCTEDAGGVYTGDGHIVGMIRDGDSVATLMRM